MGAYKDKNGTWYAQFRFTNWKGEADRKTKRGFATKKEALEWEREFLTQSAGNLEMTFEAFYELYKKNLQDRLKKNTWKMKTSVIESKILPYLQEYYQVRNEYATQNFGYGANKAKVGNLQSLINETEFLSERRIYSVADLESYVSSASARNSKLAEQIRKDSERISKLKDALRQLENYHKYKPIADELNTIKFKGKREKFQTEHNSELAMFYMAKRVLKEVGLKEKDMRSELEQLTKEVNQKKEEQGKCYHEVQELSRIA